MDRNRQPPTCSIALMRVLRASQAFLCLKIAFYWRIIFNNLILTL